MPSTRYGSPLVKNGLLHSEHIKACFSFNVMPFGLKNAPSTFQSMIDSVLGELLGVCVVAYLDDLLIYSENKEDHADHLRAVSHKLRNANLVAKLSKCKIFKSEVTLLGNIFEGRTCNLFRQV